MRIQFNRSVVLAVTAVAFVGGVLFASSMDWTRLLRAQPGPGAKPPATQVQSLTQQQDAFVSIAERVTPAVVSIDAQRDARRTDQRPRPRAQQNLPPGFEQFFQFDDPQQRDQEQTGSGFIVSKDGYVLTNNHVVEGADRIKVVLTDRREFTATLVGTDPSTDLALLKVKAEGLPVVKMGDSDLLRVGEWVCAIGNPLGLDFTVTAGIISAKGRSNELRNLNPNQYAIQDFLQTDAAINPGNSGGPLVNIRGEVIGINSAIASQTGTYAGYGFAIPITLAKTVMDDIIAHGRVRRAIMGAAIFDVNAEDASVNKLATIAGVKVQGFSPMDEDSPAKKAGLLPGDVIIKLDGKSMDRVSTLQRMIRAKQPGDVVELEAVRYGEHKTFKVKLVEAPGEETKVASDARPRNDGSVSPAPASISKLGIALEGLTSEVIRANRIPDSTATGVRVIEVVRGGPAEGRLSRDDLIAEVIFPAPKTPVRTVADLQRVVGKLHDGDYVGLMVYFYDRAGKRQSRVVNLRVGG